METPRRAPSCSAARSFLDWSLPACCGSPSRSGLPSTRTRSRKATAGCGESSQVSMAHTPLRGLRPQSYEHPSDKKTLDVLQSQSGLETLIRKFNEYGVDRLLRVQLMGSYLRATEDSFSELDRAVQEGCQILDVPKRPAVYIQPGGLNAFTAGVDQPILVFNAGLVDAMTEDELRFV